MICERCLQEKNIQPFMFVGVEWGRQRQKMKHVGYLKICTACYRDIEELYNLGCLKDAQEKRQAVLRPLFILFSLLLIISSLWICYIKFGEYLSNGKDPANYTVFTQRPGGITSSYSASRIDVDPLPVVALVGLIAVSGLFAWMISCAYSDALIPVLRRSSMWRYKYLRKEFQTNQHAMSLSERKVYQDTEFTKIDNHLTYELFWSGRKVSSNGQEEK